MMRINFQKVSFIAIFLLIVPLLGIARNMEVKGYYHTEYIFPDECGVSIICSLKSSSFKLIWFQSPRSKVEYVAGAFESVSISSVHDDRSLGGRAFSSDKLLLDEYSTGQYDGLVQGIKWYLGKDGIGELHNLAGGAGQPNFSQDLEFVDYTVSGKVVLYDDVGGVASEYNFEIPMIREYKKKTIRFFQRDPDNWKLSRSRLYIYSNNEPKINIKGSDYSQIYGIISIDRWGEMAIENGEFRFLEHLDKRKVFYVKKSVNKVVETANGRKRVHENIYGYPNPKKYPYKSIYEWGYKVE